MRNAEIFNIAEKLGMMDDYIPHLLSKVDNDDTRDMADVFAQVMKDPVEVYRFIQHLYTYNSNDDVKNLLTLIILKNATSFQQPDLDRKETKLL